MESTSSNSAKFAVQNTALDILSEFLEDENCPQNLTYTIEDRCLFCLRTIRCPPQDQARSSADPIHVCDHRRSRRAGFALRPSGGGPSTELLATMTPASVPHPLAAVPVICGAHRNFDDPPGGSLAASATGVGVGAVEPVGAAQSVSTSWSPTARDPGAGIAHKLSPHKAFVAQRAFFSAWSAARSAPPQAFSQVVGSGAPVQNGSVAGSPSGSSAVAHR